MKLGVVFPQTEIGSDPTVVRDYAQAVEGLGFDHLLAYDHVLGADPDRPGGWSRAYNVETTFHEPLVLFGYLAGLTQRIEMVTNIIILPQRQTALVAKQAAQVDLLSGGRLRLGVGLGWNHVEYQALNEDFETRGRRIGEQIEVMRRLWTQGTVDFAGKYHTIDRAGIRPLPVQQPIPVWFGGNAIPAVLRRIGRYGDGWFPQIAPDDAAREALDAIYATAEATGRKREDIGIEARAEAGRMGPEGYEEFVRAWQGLGATHMGINTMNAGFTSIQQHIDAITRFKEVVTPLVATA